MNPVRKTLAKLGVVSSYKGHDQIELALRLVMEEGYTLSSVMKVYEEVGRRTGASAASVERNIRTIINRVYMDSDRLEAMAEYPLFFKPKPAEFLSILCNYIQQYLTAE